MKTSIWKGAVPITVELKRVYHWLFMSASFYRRISSFSIIDKSDLWTRLHYKLDVHSLCSKTHWREFDNLSEHWQKHYSNKSNNFFESKRRLVWIVSFRCRSSLLYWSTITRNSLKIMWRTTMVGEENSFCQMCASRPGVSRTLFIWRAWVGGCGIFFHWTFLDLEMK